MTSKQQQAKGQQRLTPFQPSGEIMTNKLELHLAQSPSKVDDDEDQLTGDGSLYSYLLWFPIIVAIRGFNFVLALATAPIFLVLRLVFNIQVEPVSFWNVSLRRRKETAAVAAFILLLPMSGVFYFITFLFLIFPLTTIPTMIYIYHILTDKAPVTGSRYPFMRYWKLWRHYVHYFPLHLMRKEELDANKKYVFCYHPHGIISLGAFGNFATNATGFTDLFPGIDLRLLTLKVNFYAPLVREAMLSMGMCAASKEACDNILSRGAGSAVMLVVGGAQESLDAAPGTYRLTLNRQGFVRVALENGAELVPVLGFGETDVFDTYVYEKHSNVRQMQERFKRWFGFALPVFHGRGMFNYTFGFLPHRRPIYAVVGSPVTLPKWTPVERQMIVDKFGSVHDYLTSTEEGVQLVNNCHQDYIKALVRLYDEFKNQWAMNRSESIRILGDKRNAY